MLNDSKVLLGQKSIREKIRCYLELNNWDKETIARFNMGGWSLRRNFGIVVIF